MKYQSIRPGQEWLDTSGKPIEAHGGAVFYENGVFYWYGENKEYSDGKNKIWTWGIKCYSSTDLYNWKDEGFIVDAQPDEKDAPFYPENHIDRPHILYNESTKKYVMWVKFSGELACFAILTADTILGKYRLEKMNFRPFGKKAGDFDLVKAENGKAYVYFESDHKNLTCAELSEDYLDVTDKESTHFEGLYPPFIREAPAYVTHEGKHYLITSGLTGYVPNPSETAVSDSFHGPFRVLGSPHLNDTSSASFNSQISFIFKHPKKDFYIAMADRWLPDFTMTAEKYDVLKRTIASNFAPDKYSATMEEKMQLNSIPLLATANTSAARYVWLPLVFENGVPVIRWYDEWRVEDFR